MRNFSSSGSSASTKGELTIDVLHQRVWLRDGAEPAALCWHLLVRRELGARADLKYSLSNAAAETPVLRLAQMQGQHAGKNHTDSSVWD